MIIKLGRHGEIKCREACKYIARCRKIEFVLVNITTNSGYPRIITPGMQFVKLVMQSVSQSVSQIRMRDRSLVSRPHTHEGWGLGTRLMSNLVTSRFLLVREWGLGTRLTNAPCRGWGMGTRLVKSWPRTDLSRSAFPA